MTANQILKNLHAVLVYSKERYNNEFVMQEVVLNDTFKSAYRNYLMDKQYSVTYFDNTSVISNKKNQNIFVPNQWFAISSYFVDFCTEMLTYKGYFDKICATLGYQTGNAARDYATRLRTAPSITDKNKFISAAVSIFKNEFPDSGDNYNRVADNLWSFASDYAWWAGNKTIDRNDFFVSPLLSQLNVVNASSEFLANIVNSYATNLNLRKLTENVLNFTVGMKIKEYKPGILEQKSYNEAEAIGIVEDKEFVPVAAKGISISAASLERFRRSCGL